MTTLPMVGQFPPLRNFPNVGKVMQNWILHVENSYWQMDESSYLDFVRCSDCSDAAVDLVRELKQKYIDE